MCMFVKPENRGRNQARKYYHLYKINVRKLTFDKLDW